MYLRGQRGREYVYEIWRHREREIGRDGRMAGERGEGVDLRADIWFLLFNVFMLPEFFSLTLLSLSLPHSGEQRRKRAKWTYIHHP